MRICSFYSYRKNPSNQGKNVTDYTDSKNKHLHTKKTDGI
ncbi:unnamed protein product [Acidithrix sp. C25]|nr:unnamed protein product [Acidithrix sp. C25]